MKPTLLILTLTAAFILGACSHRDSGSTMTHSSNTSTGYQK